jgi:hypothetical protein
MQISFSISCLAIEKNLTPKCKGNARGRRTDVIGERYVLFAVEEGMSFEMPGVVCPRRAGNGG